MTEYFLKLITNIEKELDEIKSYFRGRKKAADILGNPEMKAAFKFNVEENCYELLDDMDPDEFISKIENGSIDESVTTMAIESGEEEEIIKPMEGTIRKRKDGRWEGRYYYNHVQRSVFAYNQKDCIAKLKQAITDRNRAIKILENSKKVSLDAWFDLWLKTYKPKIKEQSRYAISSKYEKYIKKKIGKRKIATITTMDLQLIFNNIEYPVTRKKLYTYMKDIFDKARVNKIVYENVMEGVILFNDHRTKKGFVPEPDQLKLFLDYLDKTRPELMYLCEFISLTGMRIGEACAVTLKDIDFDNKTITINKSYNRYSREVASTKTYASNRVIPLFDAVADIINEYTNKYHSKDVIFHMIKSENATNSVKYHAKKCGLDGLSPHGLRRYFASRCKAAGIDQKVTQGWMGHESILMTMDTYTRVQDDLSLKQAEIFNKFIKK